MASWFSPPPTIPAAGLFRPSPWRGHSGPPSALAPMPATVPRHSKSSLLPVQRPGSTQKTPRSMGSLSRRNNAIFADDPILFPSGHDLAGQQDQRPFRVVDQHQLVDLRARTESAAAPAHQWLHASGFGHDHLARAQPFVQGEKFLGVVGARGHDWKYCQVAVPDGCEHLVAGGRGHVLRRGRWQGRNRAIPASASAGSKTKAWDSWCSSCVARRLAGCPAGVPPAAPAVPALTRGTANIQLLAAQMLIASGWLPAMSSHMTDTVSNPWWKLPRGWNP